MGYPPILFLRARVCITHTRAKHDELSERLLSNLFLDLTTHHTVSDRRSNEDGRQRTEDNTEGHGEVKALDAATTDEQDAEQHDQRGE